MPSLKSYRRPTPWTTQLAKKKQQRFLKLADDLDPPPVPPAMPPGMSPTEAGRRPPGCPPGVDCSAPAALPCVGRERTDVNGLNSKIKLRKRFTVPGSRRSSVESPEFPEGKNEFPGRLACISLHPFVWFFHLIKTMMMTCSLVGTPLHNITDRAL